MTINHDFELVNLNFTDSLVQTFQSYTNSYIQDFHSTKQGLSLVDSWSRGLD